MARAKKASDPLKALLWGFGFSALLIPMAIVGGKKEVPTKLAELCKARDRKEAELNERMGKTDGWGVIRQELREINGGIELYSAKERAATCGDAPPTTASHTPASASPSVAVAETPPGTCARSPLEIFPVGETIDSDSLAAITQQSCPRARFHPDQRIEVFYDGQRYFVQTYRLNSKGAPRTEVQSIRSN